MYQDRAEMVTLTGPARWCEDGHIAPAWSADRKANTTLWYTRAASRGEQSYVDTFAQYHSGTNLYVTGVSTGRALIRVKTFTVCSPVDYD